jgi:hypothetical protein
MTSVRQLFTKNYGLFLHYAGQDITKKFRINMRKADHYFETKERAEAYKLEHEPKLNDNHKYVILSLT